MHANFGAEWKQRASATALAASTVLSDPAPLMTLPSVNEDQVKVLFPELVEVGRPIRGGQKLVFPCVSRGGRFVLKVLKCDVQAAEAEEDAETDGEETAFDLAAERARREVDVLRACNSPHIAKLGPIALRQAEVAGEQLIIFSEEFIDGRSLEAIIEQERLPVTDLVSLAGPGPMPMRSSWLLGKESRQSNTSG
jgi:hypothetical protein